MASQIRILLGALMIFCWTACASYEAGLAYSLYAEGELEDCLELLNAHLEDVPGDSAARLVLAEILADTCIQNDDAASGQRAIDLLEELSNDTIVEANARPLLGYLLLRNGDAAGAEATLEPCASDERCSALRLEARLALGEPAEAFADTRIIPEAQIVPGGSLWPPSSAPGNYIVVESDATVSHERQDVGSLSPKLLERISVDSLDQEGGTFHDTVRKDDVRELGWLLQCLSAHADPALPCNKCPLGGAIDWWEKPVEREPGDPSGDNILLSAVELRKRNASNTGVFKAVARYKGLDLSAGYCEVKWTTKQNVSKHISSEAIRRLSDDEATAKAQVDILRAAHRQAPKTMESVLATGSPTRGLPLAVVRAIRPDTARAQAKATVLHGSIKETYVVGDRAFSIVDGRVLSQL